MLPFMSVEYFPLLCLYYFCIVWAWKIYTPYWWNSTFVWYFTANFKYLYNTVAYFYSRNVYLYCAKLSNIIFFVYRIYFTKVINLIECFVHFPWINVVDSDKMFQWSASVACLQAQKDRRRSMSNCHLVRLLHFIIFTRFLQNYKNFWLKCWLPPLAWFFPCLVRLIWWRLHNGGQGVQVQTNFCLLGLGPWER